MRVLDYRINTLKDVSDKKCAGCANCPHKK